jgi:hypothetical protein
VSDPAKHLEEHERKFYDAIKANVAGNESHALFIVLITFENLSKERGLRKAAEAEIARRNAVCGRVFWHAEAQEDQTCRRDRGHPGKCRDPKSSGTTR